MANYDNPNGFRPITSNPVRHTYTSASALAEGDVVAQDATTGKVELFAASKHPYPIGVVARPVAAADLSVEVFDDLENTEFVGQFEGTFNALTSTNKRFDLKGTTGIMEIDGAASKWGSVHVLGQYPVVGSTEVGSNARVRCRFGRVGGLGMHTIPKLIEQLATCTEATMGADRDITAADGRFLKLTLTGSARAATFAAALERAGNWYVIQNAAASALDLTVKDSAGSTMCVLNQNQGALVVHNGTTWRAIGFTTIVDLTS